MKGTYTVNQSYRLAIKRTMGILSLMASFGAASNFAQAPNKQTLESCSTPNSLRVKTSKWIAFATLVHYSNGSAAKATKLAEALETVYDTSVFCLVQRGVSKDEAERIDSLMDGFIKPIQGATTKAPEPDAVASAYRAFVAEIDTIKDVKDKGK